MLRSLVSFLPSCLLNGAEYTITYFFPIPSIRPSTRARSKLLNVSPVAPPCQVLYSSACIVTVLIVMFINSFV